MIHKKQKIAAAVVLHDPDDSDLKNIHCFNCLGQVFVVDNSTPPALRVHNELGGNPRISLIVPGKNIGIAAALNLAASAALKAGYDWLLTMDQDSRFHGKNLGDLVDSLAFVDTSTTGIVCARYADKDCYVEMRGHRFNALLVTITSGSLLNLKAYGTTGPFLEKLFVDQVDHEYCLRLKRHGFKVLQAKGVVMDHRLGRPQYFLGSCVSHHPPFRRYYMTRNRFYVANLYRKTNPKFYWVEMARNAFEMLKILLAEKEKNRKLKAALTGYMDYRKGRFDRDGGIF